MREICPDQRNSHDPCSFIRYNGMVIGNRLAKQYGTDVTISSSKEGSNVIKQPRLTKKQKMLNDVREGYASLISVIDNKVPSYDYTTWITTLVTQAMALIHPRKNCKFL